MKAISASIFVAACFLAACSSEEPKVQPQSISAQPKVYTPVTTPTTGGQISVNPLDDPSSILSKRSIYYDYQKAKIKTDFNALIQAHGQYLASHPNAKVRIEGNCDERGSREYNLALGQRRADSVKTALELQGAKDGQIDTVSYGKEKPKAEGHSEAAWAQNRRSDIIYLNIQ